MILIGIAAYGKKQAMLVSLPALGGVIACGVFLLLIAVVGLIGAIRHNQIILFFVSFQNLLNSVPLIDKCVKCINIRINGGGWS